MLMEQLKAYSGKVDTAGLKSKVNTGLKSTGEAAREGVRVARHGLNGIYSAAMNNPRATAAVVLGAGVAAALIWIATRDGTFSAIRRKVTARVKRAPARRSAAARARTSRSSSRT